MRDIKFRAWNEYAKSMYEVDVLHIRNRGWRMPAFNDGESNYMSLVYQPKVVLMQFTGHQTIDEMDVYEGDILQFYSDKEEIEGYYTVEWIEETGQWGLMFGDPEHRIQMGTIGMARFMKVAGNIYENKELLA